MNLNLWGDYTLKKKRLIVISAVILLFLCAAIYKYQSIPDGQTIESREQLLKGIPKGAGWQISTEQLLNDYIVSGIYSTDGKNGIAVFEPTGKGRYKLSSREWRESGRIVISGYAADGIWYDLVWFNDAQTQYAEITYTVDGDRQETIKHNSTNMEIFIHEAPAKDYSIDVVYYDSKGNVYE